MTPRTPRLGESFCGMTVVEVEAGTVVVTERGDLAVVEHKTAVVRGYTIFVTSETISLLRGVIQERLLPPPRTP